ncbi:MAG: hypothetical protein AVDCRST_MAG87-1984 [uncultured Thermomicrobiales bacterium]|uniref:Uncharacterized protein n=1 Tax=uncultured Thermomicrobiales bacterium TaxID=1645740 RepID=A0A6J4V236_9BACT|nr:MAG: hypothetical protein AVDCRST_MAG87-1984 [uncultured Thermomicrobiales bacterium]
MALRHPAATSFEKLCVDPIPAAEASDRERIR